MGPIIGLYRADIGLKGIIGIRGRKGSKSQWRLLQGLRCRADMKPPPHFITYAQRHTHIHICA